MSIESVRAAFQRVAGQALRLDHLGLQAKQDGQVIAATGWHADGLPFASATAPFHGDPLARAGNLARDLIAAHHGAPQEPRSTERMSQKGSGLARLMGGLKNLDTSADALAERLETAMQTLNTELATTSQIVNNVEKSVGDLQAVNALYSNGPESSTGNSGDSSVG